MNTKSLEILMVEDSESDASYIIRTLEKAGFKARFEMVTTRLEMQTALKRQRFDLVLSDYNLPQFSASGALEEYKSSGLDGPFIIVSGAIGEETAVSLLKKGAQDYVMKGNLARLAPVVERELNDAEIRRQRKKSEARLLESEQRFHQVAEVAGEIIWEVDTSSRYLYVNPVAEKVMGYTPDEIIGKMSIYDLLPPENRQYFKNNWQEYLDEKQKIKGIISTRVRKDGSLVILKTSAAPVLDSNGNLTGYRGTDTDITERKQGQDKLRAAYAEEIKLRQQLEEEAKTRIRFIDVLAHELRGPLTPLMSSAEILQEIFVTDSTSLQRELAGNIFNASQAMSKRLDELLDMARSARGTFTLNLQSTDIKTFMEAVVTGFKPSMSRQNQQMLLEVANDLSAAQIDPLRMEQVLVNLLSNASKYSPEKSRIRLSAAKQEDNLLVAVRDEGMGISQEDQSKLFQPYQRVGQRSKYTSGLGLGLVVVKQIIEAHGGKVWVNSQIGKGSTFSFSIPMIKQLEKKANLVSAAN